MSWILSDIYNGQCCGELWVTLAYLELCHLQNPKNIWNPVKDLWCSIFLDSCVTLVYLEPWYMQNPMNNQNPVKYLYDVAYDVAFLKWNLTYSEPWDILKPWHIQNPVNPVKHMQWSILFRTIKYNIFSLLIHSKT